MCCIFTCLGWTLDLIQRLWTFFMACLISCAVCLALLIASMAGIALGYNYSLSEYIDLKETNVSIYLKRGVFDEDLSEQSAGWRRNMAGGDNSEAAQPQLSEQSARRLDNSIYASDDHNKFEGSLMKLTAKVPHPEQPTTATPNMHEFINKLANPVDQMKAVNTIINSEKEKANYHPNPKKSQPTNDERYMDPYYLQPLSDGRRVMLPEHMKAPNRTPGSMRAAVPDESMVDPVNWMLPKMALKKEFTPDLFNPEDFDASPTFPIVPTPRPGPIRPTVKRYRPTVSRTSKPAPQSLEDSIAKSIEEHADAYKELEKIKQKVPLQADDQEFRRKSNQGSNNVDDEDYDTRGIPIRKRRLAPSSRETSKTASRLDDRIDKSNHIAITTVDSASRLNYRIDEIN